MEVEYSTSRSSKYAFTFCEWEMKEIAKALKPLLKKYDKKMDKISNHPENEGQVTFIQEIQEIYRQKELIEGIIKEFSK